MPTFWETLLSGGSGIDHITQFPTEGFGVDIAGEVKNIDSSKAGVDRKEARRLAPYVLYAMSASREALLQSGVLESSFVPQRVATIIGTGIGHIRQIELEMDVLRKRGPRRVSPLLVPSGTPEVSPSEVARLYGFKGPSFSVAFSSDFSSLLFRAPSGKDQPCPIRARPASTRAGGYSRSPRLEPAFPRQSGNRALQDPESLPKKACLASGIGAKRPGKRSGGQERGSQHVSETYEEIESLIPPRLCH